VVFLVGRVKAKMSRDGQNIIIDFVPLSCIVDRSMKKAMILFLILMGVSCQGYSEELTLAGHVQRTAEDAFDTTGLWILGVGTAATLLSFQWDQHIHDTWADHQQMSANISQYGNFWGTGIPEALIIGGQIYYDKDNGIPALEGFALGGIVTHSAKILIGRERPDSSTRTSMPSGHTQAAFSLAASMTESYGWKVGLPFWGLGVFTGLSRLADDAHWFSDVVAGATIGILFGRAGYKHHREIQPVILFHHGNVDGAAVSIRMDW